MRKDLVELSMRIPAVLSILGCSVTVATFFCFKRLRELRYVEFVFYVALNDLIASIDVCLGFQRSGSVGCWIQGIGTGINFLSSVFWSTAIAYQVFSIIYTGKGIENMAACHVVCWLFPVVLTLLPLSTNTYGQADDGFWCFVAERQNSPVWGVVLFDILSFFFWIWLCVLITVVLFVAILIRINSLSSSFSSMAVSKSVYLLVFYPIILVVCWVPPTVVVVQDLLLHESQYSAVLHAFALASPASQGFLLSLVFFCNNSFARREWWMCLCRCCDAKAEEGSLEEGQHSYILYEDPLNVGGNVRHSGTVNSSAKSAPSNKSSVFTLSDGIADISNSESSGHSLRHTMATVGSVNMHDDI